MAGTGDTLEDQVKKSEKELSALRRRFENLNRKYLKEERTRMVQVAELTRQQKLLDTRVSTLTTQLNELRRRP